MEEKSGPSGTTLDSLTARRWAAASVHALESHRATIDAMNVYPVADSDTGTNLLHTMRSALDASALLPASAELPAVLRAMASGALAGARGNSGVILSQMLRGFAEALERTSAVRHADLVRALRMADSQARAAVAEPVEGTMLTVLHTATVAALGHEDLATTCEALAAAAAAALQDTPRELDALARAGVLDAGAQGLVLVLDELAKAVGGYGSGAAGYLDSGRARGAATPDHVAGGNAGSDGGYQYEVMYSLHGAGERAAAGLRSRLRGIGDCVSVVTDGTGLWTVHVHCDDVGGAIEAGIDAGRPRGITVVRFAEQAQQASVVAPETTHAVVVVVRGSGLAGLCRAAGAVVIALAPGAEPDIEDIVGAIEGTGAREVTVLPYDEELVRPCAQAVARVTELGSQAVVVPVVSPVQGLAALAVHDPGRRPADDHVAMAEAAAATRRGALRVAEQEALTWVGRCSPGDVLGMVDGEVVFIEPGPPTAELGCALLRMMLGAGGELVTVLLGEGAAASVASALESYLRESHPEVEYAAYNAGLTDAVLVLGVE